jgi:hypothetical protein
MKPHHPTPRRFAHIPPDSSVFPWKDALAATRLSPFERGRYAIEIQRFLRYCEVLELPVDPSNAREYLAIVPLLSARPHARRALRWYFRAARRFPPARATAPRAHDLWGNTSPRSGVAQPNEAREISLRKDEGEDPEPWLRLA